MAIELRNFYRTARDFDRFAERLAFGVAAAEAGPAYDISETAKNHYEISVALPGWKLEDLTVGVDGGVLTVKGQQAPSQTDENGTAARAIYRGIARQAFERRFNLAEHVEVRSASFEDGILKLELVREVPEALKPRTVPIGSGAKPAAVSVQEAA